MASEDDHQTAVVLALSAARALLTIDLEHTIAVAERALEIAPFVDPTAFLTKGDDLRHDIEVLRAALPLYRLAVKRTRTTGGTDGG